MVKNYGMVEGIFDIFIHPGVAWDQKFPRLSKTISLNPNHFLAITNLSIVKIKLEKFDLLKNSSSKIIQEVLNNTKIISFEKNFPHIANEQ